MSAEQLSKPPGHKPTYNTPVMVLEGKKIHVPHAGLSLRTIIAFASSHYHGGSRYYDVIFNGVHLAKVAVPLDLLKRKKNDPTPGSD